MRAWSQVGAGFWAGFWRSCRVSAGPPGCLICRARAAGGRFGLDLWSVTRIGSARTGSLNFLSTAAQFLIRSGTSPGSPQLDDYGPSLNEAARQPAF